VEYSSEEELRAAAAAAPGSLTATVHAEPADADLARGLVAELAQHVGRVVYNGWPTGVAVNHAMHHGGPWPATTAPLHTSVGTAAIRRFQVPVAFQGLPEELLPPTVR
jgi:NADP-dependent aldehyde dehydrogenase